MKATVMYNLAASELHRLESTKKYLDSLEDAHLMTIRVKSWPPSVNGYWRQFNGRIILTAKARKFYHNALAQLVREKQLPDSPIEHPVAIRLAFYPPDMRVRDIDNFIKPCFDLLNRCGTVWSDDSLVKDLRAFFCEPRKGGQVRIEIYDHAKILYDRAEREDDPPDG